jgi:REP element-mobilizing transposase RayT
MSSRGVIVGRISFYEDGRVAWLDVLGTVCARLNWVVHTFCQMTNHYHVLLGTVDGNLSRGMRQLNGLYTQCFNRRHGVVGTFFRIVTRPFWCKIKLICCAIEIKELKVLFIVLVKNLSAMPSE